MQGSRRPFRTLALCAGASALVACGTISVKSSPPEAEVYVLLPGKEAPKSLGKTPYSADLGDVSEMVNEGTIVLVVEKRGFVPQQFVVPNLSGGELAIDVSLTPNLPSNYQEVNNIIGRVLAAERLLLEGRHKEAVEVATEIRKLNENVAAAYEIEGAAHFLMNDLEKSRFAWLRALELEPNNADAQTVLAKIEDKLGIKPTARGPTGGGNAPAGGDKAPAGGAAPAGGG